VRVFLDLAAYVFLAGFWKYVFTTSTHNCCNASKFIIILSDWVIWGWSLLTRYFRLSTTPLKIIYFWLVLKQGNIFLECQKNMRKVTNNTTVSSKNLGNNIICIILMHIWLVSLVLCSLEMKPHYFVKYLWYYSSIILKWWFSHTKSVCRYWI